MKFATAAGFLLLALPPLPARAQAEPERFEIDRNHSHVGFVTTHMMVSKVRGKFNDFRGQILFDPQDVARSAVEVEIDAASVDTNVERRDNDLRSDNFFEVEKFPRIRFVSKSVEKEGDELRLVGDLTIRDVTREVRIPFELAGPVTLPNGQKRIGAEGRLEINRHDYGLTWNRLTEGLQVVGDVVTIELAVEAATPRPQPAAQ